MQAHHRDIGREELRDRVGLFIAIWVRRGVVACYLGWEIFRSERIACEYGSVSLPIFQPLCTNTALHSNEPSRHEVTSNTTYHPFVKSTRIHNENAYHAIYSSNEYSST